MDLGLKKVGIEVTCRGTFHPHPIHLIYLMENIISLDLSRWLKSTQNWATRVQHMSSKKLPKKSFSFFYILAQGHDFIDLREGGRQWGREENTDVRVNINQLLPARQTGWNPQPGKCPDRESNLWPSGVHNKAPTDWATPARAKIHSL